MGPGLLPTCDQSVILLVKTAASSCLVIELRELPLLTSTTMASKPKTFSDAGDRRLPNPAEAHWRTSSGFICREDIPMSVLPAARSAKAKFEPCDWISNVTGPPGSLGKTASTSTSSSVVPVLRWTDVAPSYLRKSSQSVGISLPIAFDPWSRSATWPDGRIGVGLELEDAACAVAITLRFANSQVFCESCAEPPEIPTHPPPCGGWPLIVITSLSLMYAVA